ncbi:glycosyltransferase family 2 protein [Microbacterium esteraromaticum]|uniref:glycosyltransferase family 2 protein n=1 Tax=Microbacterium esteraromaticum TaxID=57043 RepID=UPI0015F3DA2C|nr:glycosyltransferase family 2 protein [Microbacterium esteraromaticum]
MQNTVSIVIPHFGDPEPTIALIDQLTNQTKQVVEIIVVDDASPVPLPDQPRATVIRRTANGGFGATCNTGARAAEGELLLFLNSDLEVPADFVEKLTDRAAPWQPCVAGPRIVDSGGINGSARHFPTIGHQVMEWLVPLARFHGTRWMSERIGHDTRVVTGSTPGVTDWVVGAAMLIPRSEFLSIGGFDEEYYMNCEEVDLQLRLNREHIPAVYIPDTSVTHVGGGSSPSTRRAFWVAAARNRYAEKWGHPNLLALALTSATVVNFGWNCIRRIRNGAVRPLASARHELALIRSSVNSH